MWIIVHFINDNAVEAVPETWNRKKSKTCAWPLNSKNSKKHIERKDYPDENNFEWIPARVLGRKYGNLEEARKKTNIAQFQSDLSANEDFVFKNKTIRIQSPPSLKQSKIRKIEQNIHDKDEPLNIFYDDDMITASISPISRSDTDQSVVVQSPIGKILVERVSSLPHQRQQNTLTSTCKSSIKRVLFPLENSGESQGQIHTPSQSASTKYDNEKTDTALISSQSDTEQDVILNSPIGKILVERVSSLLPHSRQQKPSTSFGNSVKRIMLPLDNSVAFQGQTHTISQSASKKKDFGMTDTDFKYFVINTLTKMKHEITAISSTVNSTYIAFDGFLNDCGQKTASQLASHFESSYSIDDVFPITNEDEMEILNDKIQTDKQFKLTIVSKLSLLVGTKDVGDSVRRLMNRMFTDEILTLYSLQGKKKKKNFSKLPVYQLLIDALRVHQKFKEKIDKDFNDPLANWLNHSKFRILNRSAATEKQIK